MLKTGTFIRKKYNPMFWTMTLTIAITMIVQASDSLIAGKLLGDIPLAAINIVNPIISIVIFFGILTVKGSNIFYTSAMGEFNKDRMAKLVSQGIILAVLIGVSSTALIGLTKSIYFDSLGISGNLRHYCDEYLTFYYPVFAVVPLFLFLSEIAYVDGDEKTINISNAALVVGNIVVSILMTKLWGIRAIGFGSFVGYYTSTIVIIIHFFIPQYRFRFTWFWNWKDVLGIIKYSIADAVAGGVGAIKLSVFNLLIIKYFSEGYLPVFSVVAAIISLTTLVDGVGRTMTPLVNIYRKERNSLGEKTLIRISAMYALGIGVGLCVLIMVLSNQIPVWFGLQDEVMIALCATSLKFIALLCIAQSFVYMIASYYVLCNRVLLSSICFAEHECIMPIICGVFLAGFGRLELLMSSFFIGGVLTLIATSIYVAIRYGVKKVPLIINEYNNKVYSYELCLDSEAIMKAQEFFKDILDKEKISYEIKNSIMFLCEEVLHHIYETNEKKKIIAQCDLIIDKDISFIIRDLGKIYDITDPDLEITSLRSMVLTGFIEHIHDKSNMVTTDYNRNLFRFENISE